MIRILALLLALMAMTNGVRAQSCTDYGPEYRQRLALRAGVLEYQGRVLVGNFPSTQRAEADEAVRTWCGAVVVNQYYRLVVDFDTGRATAFRLAEGFSVWVARPRS